MSNVIKKSLQTTVFTTVLGAALSVGSANAYTINSDVIELAPITPWSVSRAGTGSAQAYCTLSKTFKKDIILTLAENNSQNLTFALDFQRDRFVAQSEYNIILATDNGDSRSYEIKPATEKAFIIRVKDDPEFYENLWKSSSLVVSVNTENYRFNTADFTGGKRDISSCLDLLKETKPEKEEPKISGLKPEISNIPVSTVTEVTTKNAARIPKVPIQEVSITEPAVMNVGFRPEKLNELSKVAEQVEKLKQENLHLKTALDKERSSYEQKLADLTKNADTESDSLLQKVSALSSENQSLQQQIRNNAKQVSASATNLNQKLNAEINRLKTENRLLQTSLQSAQADHDKQALETVSLSDYESLQNKNSVLTEQIRKLTTENHQLKTLASQSTQTETETTALLKRLTGENSDLKQQISMKDEKISELSKSLTLAQSKIRDFEALAQQVSSLKAENSELARSYAQLESASGSTTPSNADSEMMALQQRYNEQKLEMQRMSQQMEQERQAFKLEQRRLENMLFDPAVTERKQLEHLAKLEEELRLANQALAEQRAMYEGGGTPAPHNISSLPGDLSNSERAALMEMSNEIERLRDEIDRLRQLSEQSVVQKAQISEKKVVLARGTTLETAPTVEEAQAMQVQAQKSLLPPVEAVKTEQSMASIETAATSSEITEPAPMPAKTQPPVMEQAATKSSVSSGPTIKSYAYHQNGKLSLALPDPFMVNTLQKQDKGFEITERKNGTVLWASDQIEGSVIRKHLQGQDFESTVDNLIANLKKQCPAPLDIDPVVLRKGTTGNLYAYDASCGNTKLGLIFFTKDGQTLSTVSYGAPIEKGDMLESKRERLIEALMDSMQS